MSDRIEDIMATLFALANMDFSRRAQILGDDSECDGLAAAVNMLCEEIAGYIHAKAQAELELRRSEAALRQSQKMEAAGRLAGGVAHDFNNILTIIMSHAELMLDDVPAGNPMRDDLEEVRTAAKRGASLTKQLLLFSRHETVESKPVELGKVMTDLCRMLGRVIGEDIKLVTTVSPELPAILGNAGHLEQVIANLVVNARDAMPLGGSLSLEATPVETPRGRHVLLKVTDNGLGMDQATLGHIFEPFFTTKERGKGTGLGLATVFGIVDKMGGWIDVASVVGYGTTFSIYFPITERVEEDTQLMPTLASPKSGETILLVEDDAPVRKVVTTILHRRGYRVIEAATASDALRAAGKFPERIDLLVTDLVMPHINGAELSRWLTEMRPDMRILFISGYTDDQVAQHDVRHGAAFLQKPFTPEELDLKVRVVLDAPPPATSGRNRAELAAS